MKGDDGFGPALIERLKGKLDVPLIDAGSAPENYVSKIAKENPETILLVDAADLGKTPGQYEILKEEDLLKSGFTTHDISAGMFVKYLKERTGAEIYMLGTQPENVSLGGKMSEPVLRALEEICTKLI